MRAAGNFKFDTHIDRDEYQRMHFNVFFLIFGLNVKYAFSSSNYVLSWNSM